MSGFSGTRPRMLGRAVKRSGTASLKSRTIYVKGLWQIVKSSATKDMIRRKKIKAKSGTRVDKIDNMLKLSIRKGAKIKTFWEKEAKAIIDILV